MEQNYILKIYHIAGGVDHEVALGISAQHRIYLQIIQNGISEQDRQDADPQGVFADKFSCDDTVDCAVYLRQHRG